ncbi:glycosyltransferase family 2 protein [Clostridium perfringens]|nr:glycosyltransferase family 2 protein [Clostridium perfringens]
MMKVSISIIVPIYNSEKYLERCIDSLINQTLRNIEIILVNDGSTDKSLNIIKRYSSMDSRIKIIDKKNGGVSSARNEGIHLSTGKYISFVDSDDWCEHDMFEKMYLIAEQYNVEFVNIGYYMENKNGKILTINKPKKFLYSNNTKEVSKILSKIELGYSVMKLYRRDILKDNNVEFNIELCLGEDAVFVQDYLMFIKSIAIIDSASYHYVRCNSQSLSNKYIFNIDKFIECYWGKYEEFSRKFPEYKEIMKNKGHTKDISATIFYIYNNYRNGCPLNRRERVKFIEKFMKEKSINYAIKNYNPIKKSHKIFKILYEFKNPYLMDFIYSLKFMLNNKTNKKK